MHNVCNGNNEAVIGHTPEKIASKFLFHFTGGSCVVAEADRTYLYGETLVDDATKCALVSGCWDATNNYCYRQMST